MVKKIVRAMVPAKLRRAVFVVRAMVAGVAIYYRDFARFLRNAAVFTESGEGRLRGRLSARYHVLEKGLSHYNPRAGFGKDAAVELARSVRAYREAGYRLSCSQYQSAIAVLERYQQVQDRSGAEVPRAVREAVTETQSEHDAAFEGGYTMVDGEKLKQAWRGDFAEVAANRHSIRYYDNTPVDEQRIRAAVEIARHAPSSCNRQTLRVHVLRDRERFSGVLEAQGGTRGFGEVVDKVLLVTSDLRCYAAFSERNLAYVDGGLFAMELMHALGYAGLGSCPLHMALRTDQDRRIRALAGLEDWETPIVMLGVGNVASSFKVAHSQRKPVEEYLVIH